MKVAIIGAGVSGLTAAYLLRRSHDIEIFEQRRTAGGHANTVLVPGGDGAPMPLDVGFIVYSERTYPGFTRLLRELGVQTQPSDMSFSFRSEVDGFEFSSRGLRGYLAQPRNAVRPSVLRMGLDMLRFQRQAHHVLREDSMHNVTFEEYLDRWGYSRAFRDRLIVPLTASTWSNSPADILRFPVNYLFRFLDQHGVLERGGIPQWRWIRGGARTYVERVLATLPEGSAHLGEPVAEVRRDAEGATLCFDDGYSRRFDAVVFATHADETRRLLADESDMERQALGGISYAPNHVVLHTDERLLPRSRWARASWNYQQPPGDGASEQLTMTYDLNRLQGIPGDTHYCVSVNPGDGVDPAAVLARFDYSHPVFTIDTPPAQRAIEAIQGERRTYFAGAYLGYGFHEDGVQAGVRVAKRLGVTW